MSSIIERMRANIKPRCGALSPLVYIHLNEGTFYDPAFIGKCIAELEGMEARSELGQPPSCLEQLAYDLLKDSAFISMGAQK
jgi:hypothetical protein